MIYHYNQKIGHKTMLMQTKNVLKLESYPQSS